MGDYRINFCLKVEAVKAKQQSRNKLGLCGFVAAAIPRRKLRLKLFNAC
jgi:hypothetical protein